MLSKSAEMTEIVIEGNGGYRGRAAARSQQTTTCGQQPSGENILGRSSSRVRSETHTEGPGPTFRGLRLIPAR